MKKCICILILISSSSIAASEHIVRPGDSLWSLAKQYLGSGNKWPQITYMDGSHPSEFDLTVGRTLVFPVGSDKPQRLNTMSKPPVTQAVNRPASQTAQFMPVVEFNTSMYCCAESTVVMNQQGAFEIVSETHPFFAPPMIEPKPKMKTFMNIRISEDLLHAFDNQ